MSGNPPRIDATGTSALVRIPSPLIDVAFDGQMAERANAHSRASARLGRGARVLLIAHESGWLDDAALAPINADRSGIVYASELLATLLADLTANAVVRANALVAEAGLDASDEEAQVHVALDEDTPALAVSNAEVVRGILISALTDVDAAPDTDDGIVATAALRASVGLSTLGPMVDCVTHARMDDDMMLMSVLCDEYGHWMELIEEWLMGDRPESRDEAWAELCACEGCDTDYDEAERDFGALWVTIKNGSFASDRFSTILENNEATPEWLATSADALDERALTPGIAHYLRGLIALGESFAPLRQSAVAMDWDIREGPLFMFGVLADELDLAYARDQHEMAMQSGGDLMTLLDLAQPGTTMSAIEDALTLCYAQVLAFEAMPAYGFTGNNDPENSDDE